MNFLSPQKQKQQKHKVMKRIAASLLLVIIATTVLAQQRSAKRGIGWDERNVNSYLSDAAIEKMAPGVSWIYTWGQTPKGTTTLLGTGEEGSMDFAPMCWRGTYDANAIRNYVKNHPGVKYLLGFNEPNFAVQANMTPADAADKWPGVEALTNGLGLKLVAPALNFTGEAVGGKVWQPYEWFDEFIKKYKEKHGKLPHMDCLALHCYMDWYGAVTWFATEYFYKDLFDNTKEAYGKYPNIVELLNSYKATHGHFPRMMLTEFCAWEESCTSVDFQIDQMTQKLQKLEQSDLVEGYAWFMANPESNDGKPWMGCFVDGRHNDSELNDLGKIYVNMSTFDTKKYYGPDEQIQAKDYVDASTDARQVKVRPNTDRSNSLPLQIELPSFDSFSEYQIDVPRTGQHEIRLRIKTSASVNLRFYVDEKEVVERTLPNTYGRWKTCEFTITLTEGKHSVILYNAGISPIFINYWMFGSNADGIEDIKTSDNAEISVYSLNGVKLGGGKSLQDMHLTKGVYIISQPDEEKKKIVIK